MIWELLLKTFIHVSRIFDIEDDIFIFSRNGRKSSATSCKLNIIKKQNQKYYEISTKYECVEKLSMVIGCNTWKICLELNWFFYDPRCMLELFEFVWKLRSSV